MFAITVRTTYKKNPEMSNRYLYITLLTLLGFSAETTAQATQQAPQLVVSIAIEQVRTDQLEAYAPAVIP